MSRRFESGKLSIILLLGVFLVAGIGGSIWGGNNLQKAAHDHWLEKARTDVARITENMLFWVSKTEVNLRAIAGQIQGMESINNVSFRKLIEAAETWDPDVSFSAVGFAQRILRDQRAAYEQETGAALTKFQSPEKPAPEVYESFAMRYTAPVGGMLREHMDLTTHPAMRTVVITARQTPGHVILGPAFKGADGDQYSLVATATGLLGANGVMVATLNLTEFFSGLVADALPPHMRVRLIQRDNDARATTGYSAVIGPLKPYDGTAATEVIRVTKGQARWDLRWDILPNYLGGPADASANLVRYGGTVLTILIFGILAFLSFQNIRFQILVDDRTAELAQNAMIIQLTMGSIDQGFAVWNADQRLVVWSKRCLGLWYQPADIVRIGMHMTELLEHLATKGVFGEGDPAGIAARVFKRIVAAGEASDEVFDMLDERKIHVRRFPLERGGYVGVYTDITEREHAIERLNQANKELLAAKEKAEAARIAKTEFLSSVSHELRTPLNAVMGFSQVLERDRQNPLTDKQRNAVGHIRGGGEHLLNLINDILDLARIESGKLAFVFENVSPVDVIENVSILLGSLAEEHNINLEMVDAQDQMSSYIRADATRLQQVLLNLLSNAVKYNKPGGVVRLDANIVGKNWFRFTIEDDGIGIATVHHENLFEPFNRLGMEKSEIDGTGIGLSITKGIVDQMGGEWVFPAWSVKAQSSGFSFP